MKKLTLLTSLIAAALASAEQPAQKTENAAAHVAQRVKTQESNVPPVTKGFTTEEALKINDTPPLPEKDPAADDASAGAEDGKKLFDQQVAAKNPEPAQGSGRAVSPDVAKIEPEQSEPAAKPAAKPAQPEQAKPAEAPKAADQGEKADKEEGEKVEKSLQQQLEEVSKESMDNLQHLSAAFDDAASVQVADASQKLLNQLQKNQPNAVVSGVGAVVLLKAIAAGAQGASLEQLSTWLGGDMNADSIAGLLAASDDALTQAAAMMIPKKHFGQIKPEYRQKMTDQGMILVDDLDALNAKVNEVTRGKIPTALKKLPANTRLVLTHALHFAAPWETHFSEDATKDAPFITLNGKKVKKVNVPMMHNGAIELRWLKDKDILGVRVPFSGGYSLFIAMPTGDKPTAAALDHAAGWLKDNKKTLLNTRAQKTDFYLPRWSIKQSHDFVAALKKDKVTAIFNPSKADFSRMTTEKEIYVGVFKQDVQIEINEKGGEASAATTAVMVARGISIPTQTPPEVKIDRPFVYAIVHEASGVEVIRGYLNNPKGQ